jgi:O-antigen ligase
MDRIVKVRIVNEGILGSRFSNRIVHAAIQTKSIPTPIRWSFLLFVFSFPFEYVDLSFISGSHTLTKICGLLFFVSYFLYRNPFVHKKFLPHPPAALWWFMGYMLIYLMHGVFMPTELLNDFFSRTLTLVQLFGFFWIASDLLKDGRMMKSVLLTYVIACAILTPISSLQVSQSFGTTFNQLNASVSRHGVAADMMISLTIIMGFCINGSFRHLTSKMFFLMLTVPLLAVLAMTGSRAGSAAVVMSLLIYLVPYRGSKRAMISITLVTVGIVALVYMVANNPVFLERWQTAYYEGDLANRENIYPAALEMFLERPIFGWHVEFWYELSSRLGASDWKYWTEILDTHNLLLHLLLEGGVIGTIPFLVGFLLCGRAAWIARRGNLGLLPLALFSTTVMFNLSGTSLVWKAGWLIWALSVAAASVAFEEQQRQARRLRVAGAFKSAIQNHSTRSVA